MPDEKDTLVILTPGFAASETDCNCLPMQQAFVRTLKENYPGLNIIILAFHYPYARKTYELFGAKLISFGGRNKGGLNGVMRQLEVNAMLKRLHKHNRIAALLSFWYGECAMAGKRFADKNRLKHYCWILGQDARKTNKYPKRLLPGPGELIALSDFIQDEFEKNHGVRPLHIIQPGVDTRHNNVNAAEKDIDIIAAGSLIPLKQYNILLDVIAETKKERPGIKAVLIGDGPEKENLQSLITAKDLANNITLLGELPHPQVLKWMQRGRLFVHPSSYEGFGVVCIEALQAGCHVISFCKPMKQDIEQWHIAKNKEEMIQILISVLQNDATGYNIVVPFSMNAVVKKMVQLFNYQC